ncbi:heparinase II/III domain-containing protein [Paenibacillus koleovorans]|uniref:heparinase II/III domain-containing protein n=1 Tax=Paenibacillus koleovorans TaxID=121608 RepID=UPI000FD960D3|nr:heparinase II/III family protein [Paenibacillus koleovorans]
MTETVLSRYRYWEEPRLLEAENYRPLPDADDREVWEAVDAEAAAMWREAAEALAEYAWPALPASLYAAYHREGDLMAYLHPYWERRSVLGTLVVAECLEGRGRYMDAIMNGLVCICEETTWVVPHHNPSVGRGSVECLPASVDHKVELASGETAALLALAVYLLRRRLLETGGGRLVERVAEEVRVRVIDPYISRDDYWWMGFTEAKQLNNWNPWCNSNVLLALLLLEPAPAARSQGVERIVRSLDAYVRRFPADGCCQEGPMYWGGSGGMLARCLELLGGGLTDGRELADGARSADGGGSTVGRGSADGGDLTVGGSSADGGGVTGEGAGGHGVFDDPLIRSIGQYFYKVHVHDGYFVNFADGDAVLAISGSAYTYGRHIGDERLVRLGAAAPLCKPELHNWFSLYQHVRDLLDEKVKKRLAASAPYVRDAWMPDSGVFAVREHEGRPDGLFLAAKGGHNGEPHNHNDVGSFVVYADGQPVLIDIGTELYTSKTFSPQRYELWYLQSAYHNLPTIRGWMQQDGDRFRAQDVRATLGEACAELEMELANAYPEEAGITSWRRTLRLSREEASTRGSVGGFVTIVDKFDLREPTEEVAYSLITPWKPEAGDDGSFRLAYSDRRHVLVRYEAPSLRFRCEEMVLADERLRRNWGDRLYRVLLEETSTVRAGSRSLLMAIDANSHP